MSVRTVCPAKNNKYYMNGGGGYNKCIRISGNWVLQNCVGYAYGRFMEMAGIKSCKLSTSDAERWFLNTSDGYSRGKTPKVGAVICWRKGSATNRNDGCGHVAIVEEVYSDGSILISQSGYSAKKFWTQKLSKGYKINGYVFQGFIYNPHLEKAVKTENTTSKSLKVGSKITIKANAKQYGKSVKFSAAVYKNTYTVTEIKGDRVVFASGKTVMGAVKKSDCVVK